MQSAYCGAKHGIHGFFESLRAELTHDKSNVYLSMVQMPAMNTTQFGFVKRYLPNKPKPMGIFMNPKLQPMPQHIMNAKFFMAKLKKHKWVAAAAISVFAIGIAVLINKSE